MSAAALELTGVGRRYGDVVALDDVSLRVDRGELLAVVGRSGSGKSTLLNVAGTLERATGGTVRIDGVDTGALSDRRLSALRGRTIGFVFQAFHLDERLTAEQNVATALLYSGVPRARRRGIARETLERVGLAHRLQHRAGTLSGGERQRVAIARAIATDPVLVLADEPTGALDTANGELVVGLLERLRDEGATIVVITHDRALADRLPRRVELSDGRVVADSGAPARA